MRSGGEFEHDSEEEPKLPDAMMISVCHDGMLFPQADGTNGLMEDCEVERV